MKYLILTLALAGGTHALSQTCKDYYFLQNNKVVEMTMTNKKGKETGKLTYNISDVKNAGGLFGIPLSGRAGGESKRFFALDRATGIMKYLT